MCEDYPRGNPSTLVFFEECYQNLKSGSQPLPVKNTFINFPSTMFTEASSRAVRRSVSEPRSFVHNAARRAASPRGRGAKDPCRFASEPAHLLSSACSGSEDEVSVLKKPCEHISMANEAASAELVKLSSGLKLPATAVCTIQMLLKDFEKSTTTRGDRDDDSVDTGTPDESETLDHVQFAPEVGAWAYNSSDDDSPASGEHEELRMPSWSIGAAGHAKGLCRPCAWNWKPGGCSKGESCEFCHLCEEGMLKVRKKDRQAVVKERIRQQKEHRNRVRSHKKGAKKLGEAVAAMRPGLVSSPATQMYQINSLARGSEMALERSPR